MTTGRSCSCHQAVLVGVLLYGFISVGHAQVTSSGLGTVVNQPSAGVFDITGGTRPEVSAGVPGPNLFHSFGDFSLGAGESGNFLNDSGLATTNILGRVTGGNPSNIFGTIDTLDFPGANLFLINPAGILFGPTAQLNVDGSFHATTADYIGLENNGGIFYADIAQPTLLSVAAPSAFGFLTANPAPIDVLRGGVDLSTGALNLFAVPAGQTLSLVGGTINVGTAEVRDETGAIVKDAMPANLMAPGGRINLVSVASPGEATFDPATINGPLVGLPSTRDINVDGFTQLGDINIKGGLVLGGGLFLASIVNAKEVFIRGGQLTIDNALIAPGALALLGLEPLPNGGEVDVKVSGAVNISGTNLEPNSQEPSGIITFAGSPITPEFLPDAKVPDITIEADSLTVSGVASVQTRRLGPGEPANVVVNADTVTVQNGASMFLANRYQGPGGTVTINAREVNLSGDGTPSPKNIVGLFAEGQIHPFFGDELAPGVQDFDPRLTFADAASITVNATDSLSVSGDARFFSDSVGFGRAGDITVNTGDLTITGAGPESARIASQSFFTGDAGNITINASGAVELRDGGQIAGSTAGSGNGGSLTLTAGNGITFTGADSRIVYGTTPLPLDELNRLFVFNFGSTFEELRDQFGLPADAGLFDLFAVTNALGITAIPDLTAGDAGTVSINTPHLSLNADTRIEMSTGWEGNAGAVEANVGSLLMTDGARITSRSGFQRLTGEVVVGTGNAGAVNITATDTISVSGTGSSISTSTLGDGAGGDITLRSAGNVEILNGGSVTAETSAAGNAGTVAIDATGALTVSGTNSTVSTTTAGTGAGGDIALAGNEVDIVGGGTVTAEAFSTGNAGTITITATGPNTLTISGPGGTVSTATSADGAGGDIILSSAGNVEILNGGLVSADSLSTELTAGDTGSIAITAGNSIILENGNISTEAVQADGGDIELIAPNILQLTNSEITTSIFGQGAGNGGSVFIDPEFVILNKSKIIANAFAGDGGSILIRADNFIPSADSVVQASSTFGVQGTVVVASPENNIAGAIAQLPQDIVDVSGLLPERCAARRAGGAQNSFVVAGRGGLPTNPDNYLPSFSAGSVPLKSAGGPPSDTAEAALTNARDIAVAMAAWNCAPGSERPVQVQEVISQLF